MVVIRSMIRQHPSALALLCLAAMLMKLLVPTGFMLAPSSKTLTLQICTGLVETKTMEIEIPIEPGPGDNHSSQDDHQSKACPFGGSANSAFDTIDPIQLALALAFVMLLAIQIQALPICKERQRLRPPLRGPPPAI